MGEWESGSGTCRLSVTKHNIPVWSGEGGQVETGAGSGAAVWETVAVVTTAAAVRGCHWRQ